MGAALWVDDRSNVKARGALPYSHRRVCGPRSRRSFPVLVRAQPAPSPSATVSPFTAPSGVSAEAVLEQFAAAWSRVTAYKATVTVFERKDAQVQNVVLDYTFRKPSSVTVHVDAGPNAGVTMIWDGGTTVVAHRGSGLAALFKKTFSLHDPQATTIRGSSIDQLSFGAILAHAQQEAGKLTETAQADIGGVGIAAVTLMSADPGADAGLTREIVELSTSTHLPVQVLGYDGPTLVRQIGFSNVVFEL
jgi:outer membrane lipoprotein-sorting protein